MTKSNESLAGILIYSKSGVVESFYLLRIEIK
jgi:hypothetical protein